MSIAFEPEPEPEPEPRKPGSPLKMLGVLTLGLAVGFSAAGLFMESHEHPAPSGSRPGPAGGPAQPDPGKILFYRSPMDPKVTSPTPKKDDMGMDYVPVYASDVDGQAPAPGSAGKGKILFYRSPMDPKVTSPTPKQDEMGMDYVPVYESEVAAQAPPVAGRATITIDPDRQQLIGLTTAPAVMGNVNGTVTTVGTVAVDQTRVRKINVKVDGFIDKLFVDYLGMAVAKGQPLFSLYSPDFVSSQREYLLALKTAAALSKGDYQASGDDLVRAARERLRLWDVPDAEIERLAKTGQVEKDLVLRSPISGAVTAKNVVQGSRVGPGESPFEITDLSRVWVQAALYEPELSRIHVGSRAEFTLQALPGRTFEGRVAFLDPVLDPQTRTVNARLAFANPDGDLKPGMFGTAVIHGRDQQGLLIPLDALLDAGLHKVVFVSLGDGHFEPRTVTVGRTVGEQVEILSGLESGEQVVTRASFLVDSESRLKAALAQVAATPARPVKP